MRTTTAVCYSPHMSRGSPHKRRPWRVSFPMYTLNVWIRHGQAESERRRGASLALFPCFGFVPRPKDSDMTRAGGTGYRILLCRILLLHWIRDTGYRIQDIGYRIQKLGYYRGLLVHFQNSVTFHGSSILTAGCLYFTPTSLTSSSTICLGF